MSTMELTIGRFAHLGGVSVRMLRHYDERGLLVPARVDAHTGRRFYTSGQLVVLDRLRALADLGFPLAQVGELLADDLDPAAVRALLALRRADLQRQQVDVVHRLAEVEARLRLVGAAAAVPTVQRRRVAAVRLLAAAVEVADDAVDADLVEDLFDRVGAVLDAAGLSRRTPVARYGTVGDLGIGTDRGPGDEQRRADPVDQVVAGYVLVGDPPAPLPVLDGVPLLVVELPAVDVASVVHHGEMAGVRSAHRALAEWAEHTGSPGRGARTVFLAAAGSDQTGWVVDVQLELA